MMHTPHNLLEIIPCMLQITNFIFTLPIKGFLKIMYIGNETRESYTSLLHLCKTMPLEDNTLVRPPDQDFAPL